MKDYTIGFIGGGNMTSSLVGGLVADGYPAQKIWVADRNQPKLNALHSLCSVNVSTDPSRVAEIAEVLILAVKPQVLAATMKPLSGIIQKRKPLLVSVAAGVAERDISAWAGGGNVAVVRSMPNTPALVQTAATALYAGPAVTAEQRNIAESVMRAVGLTAWLRSEDQMDAVTAVSGGGPAYFFLLMELLEDAAVDLGLEADTARLLIQQTALGAAKMAMESSRTPAELRNHVTSPGGTTEQAIQSFEAGQLKQQVLQAMRAACERSRVLSQQLGEKP